MEPTKNLGGRPSLYSQELALEICSHIATGMSLRKVCEMDNMPVMTTVWRWLSDEDKEWFQQQYVRAKESSAEADQEKLEDIGDEAIRAAETTDKMRAGAVVAAYKLKADVIKWAMSKKKPKKYGEKLDLTSDGKALPTPIYSGKAQ